MYGSDEGGHLQATVLLRAHPSSELLDGPFWCSPKVDRAYVCWQWRLCLCPVVIERVGGLRRWVEWVG